MDKNFIIKVCGMSHPDNIQAVAQLSIDMMGFIFYPKSSRYVGMQSSLTGLLPDNAKKEIAGIGNGRQKRGPQKVGVFVNAKVQDIIQRVVAFDLDAIQLHGTETPTFIRNLRSTIIPDIKPTLKIFKAVGMASAGDFDICRQYEGIVDMFVFDTKCDSHGGSGKRFDWSMLNAYQQSTPFLLSGGISYGDIGRIRKINHPQFAGIDINSRFEIEPGVKDIELLAKFIKQVKAG